MKIIIDTATVLVYTLGTVEEVSQKLAALAALRFSCPSSASHKSSGTRFMIYSCEERWLVLRQMHELHGLPFLALATACNKRVSTIANRAAREGWQSNGAENFSAQKIINLTGRLARITEEKLSELSEGGKLSSDTEKQLQMVSVLAATYNKTLQLLIQLGPDNKRETDEAGHAGEDILALRSGVEAFIESIGKEEADPQISGKAE